VGNITLNQALHFLERRRAWLVKRLDGTKLVRDNFDEQEIKAIDRILREYRKAQY
jgi:hypothetical protein